MHLLFCNIHENNFLDGNNGTFKIFSRRYVSENIKLILKGIKLDKNQFYLSKNIS